MSAKADVNIADSQGRSPTLAASANGHADAVGHSQLHSAHAEGENFQSGGREVGEFHAADPPPVAATARLTEPCSRSSIAGPSPTRSVPGAQYP